MSQQVKSRPVFSRFYVGLAGPGLERAGVGEFRRRLTARLAGAVVEVGAGHGPNFACYPSTVSRLVAVEPEPLLRRHAERAADEVALAVEVVDGSAEQVPAPDDSFDAAVVSLVLCSVPDQIAALTEIARVLKPGGVLRFFEHVRAESVGLRRVQRTVDATVWPVLNGGCRSGRDTLGAFHAAGLTIAEIDRFRFPDTAFPLPAAEHVLGTAFVSEGRRS